MSWYRLYGAMMERRLWLKILEDDDKCNVFFCVLFLVEDIIENILWSRLYALHRYWFFWPISRVGQNPIGNGPPHHKHVAHPPIRNNISWITINIHLFYIFIFLFRKCCLSASWFLLTSSLAGHASTRFSLFCFCFCFLKVDDKPWILNQNTSFNKSHTNTHKQACKL